MSDLNARAAAQEIPAASIPTPKAEPVASSHVQNDEPEPVWARNRRLRQQQSELDNERGRDLLDRYGDGAMSRPRFAAVGYSWLKKKR